MKRILQIGMYPSIGGIETFLINYYRHIDKENIQFDFINMYEDKLCFSDEIESMGGKIYNVKSAKKHPIQYLRELKQIIKENNYEIVHIHMLSAANILPILAANSVGVKKIIVHSHNNNVPNGILRKVLNFINKKIITKKADVLLACSDEAGKWLFGKESKFTVINNAIDMKKFEFDNKKREEVRKKYKLENKLVIGHIGRFAEQKNHEFLIEIFEKVRQENLNAKLLLVGEGILKEKIQKQVEEKKLKDDVIFIGNSYNVSDFYQAMDAFVLPSLFEGLGIVLIEAQSNGLPCFTTKNTVPQEANISNNIEYIELNNNPEEWSTKILSKKSERNLNYLTTLDKKYDINIAVKKLEEIYTSL